MPKSFGMKYVSHVELMNCNKTPKYSAELSKTQWNQVKRIQTQFKSENTQ